MEEKSDVSSILCEFCETTSGHGYNRIFRARSKPYRRCFWAMLTSVAVVCFIYHVIALGFQYSSFKLSFNQELVSGKGMYPEITICNLFPLDITKVKTLKPVFKYTEEMNRLRATTNLSQINNNMWHRLMKVVGWYANMPFEDFHNLGHEANGFIRQCEFGGKPCDMSKWKHFSHPDFINCYSFKVNTEDLILPLGTTLSLTLHAQSGDISTQCMDNNLQFGAADGIRVFVHRPGTYPKMAQVINLPTGVSATLVVIASKVSRPPSPYSNCVETKPLGVRNETKVYTFAACHSLCIQHHVEMKCNCSTSRQLFADRDNPGMCLKVIKNNLPLTVERMNCVDKAWLEAQDTDSMKECGCYFSCEKSDYSSSPSMANWPTKSATMDFLQRFVLSSNLRVNFEEDLGPMPSFLEGLNETSHVPSEYIKYLHEANTWIRQRFLRLNIVTKAAYIVNSIFKPSYGLQDLFSDLGGCMGLWMGFSILTMVELFEFFGSLIAMLVRKNNQTRNTDGKNSWVITNAKAISD